MREGQLKQHIVISIDKYTKLKIYVCRYMNKQNFLLNIYFKFRLELELI